MEVEYSDGVLNVIVGSLGTFVLNKQAPNLQIWLSSPVTGPLRYDFCPESVAWLNSRDRHELLGRLADDFEALAGKRLDFGRVEEALAEEAARSDESVPPRGGGCLHSRRRPRPHDRARHEARREA